MPATESVTSTRNWTTILMFASTFATALVVVPWYGFAVGYHAAAWVCFFLLLGANGMSITCGYHRLLAHRAYEAQPVLKLAYLLFGAMALQGSAINWCADHRVHHRYIDDPARDPYCARLGFWHSHIGWMLRHYPSGRRDFSWVADLQRDRLVSWQHRHYVSLALAMNLGLPLLLGWICGDVFGTFLLAGVLRLVVSHHATFFINSLAHMWGSQPYNEESTARDNVVVSFLTYGEGYHNFHHKFPQDYRNGVRWWQWDPSKWFIHAMHGVGLAMNLKRVPVFKIRRARLDIQFRKTKRQLAAQPGRTQIEQLRLRVAEEYEALCAAVTAWGHLREQCLAQTGRAMIDRWERSILQSRVKVLESGLQAQYRRMRVLARTTRRLSVERYPLTGQAARG